MGILGTSYNLLFLGLEGFDITIDNQIDVEITGLYLTYLNRSSDIEIPAIPPLKMYKFNITPTEDFGENSMTLYYKDQHGELHTEYVIGYFEKGAIGSSKITLKSIDKNGKIEIEVEESMPR